jgi:hypothetical protein
VQHAALAAQGLAADRPARADQHRTIATARRRAPRHPHPTNFPPSCSRFRPSPRRRRYRLAPTAPWPVPTSRCPLVLVLLLAPAAVTIVTCPLRPSLLPPLAKRTAPPSVAPLPCRLAPTRRRPYPRIRRRRPTRSRPSRPGFAPFRGPTSHRHSIRRRPRSLRRCSAPRCRLPIPNLLGRRNGVGVLVLV